MPACMVGVGCVAGAVAAAVCGCVLEAVAATALTSLHLPPATHHPNPCPQLTHPLPPPSLQVIEELSKGIVNKLLHGPMTALRCDGADAETVAQTLANMDALERMFGLSEEEGMTPAQAQKVKQAAAGKR